MILRHPRSFASFALGLLLTSAMACGDDSDSTDQSGPTGASGAAGTGGKAGASGKGGSSGAGGSAAGAGGTAAGAGGTAAGAGGSEAGAGGSVAGTGGSEAGAAGAAGDGGASGAGAGAAGTASCHATPLGDDDDRFVIVSHPFKSGDPNKSDVYEVVKLDITGTLSKTGTTFNLGRSAYTPVVFTPDGAVGFVAEEEGKVGIFSVSSTGAVQVIDAAFDTGGSSSHMTVSPDGTRAFAIAFNTTENGGGIYEIGIGCDGTPENRGLLLAADVPTTMAILPNQTITAGSPLLAVLSARGIPGSAPGENLHLIDLASTPPKRIASVAAFPDTDVHAPALAISADGASVMVADDSLFAGNRVAVAGLTTSSLTALGVLDFPGAAWVAASPHDDSMLGLAADGKNDGYYTFSYTPGLTPYGTSKKVAVTPKPQLPVMAQVFTRGARKGLTVGAELSSVRILRLTEGGAIGAGSSLDFGDGSEGIVGVIGFAP
jgi:hypothetical protein